MSIFSFKKTGHKKIESLPSHPPISKMGLLQCCNKKCGWYYTKQSNAFLKATDQTRRFQARVKVYFKLPLKGAKLPRNPVEKISLGEVGFTGEKELCR